MITTQGVYIFDGSIVLLSSNRMRNWTAREGRTDGPTTIDIRGYEDYKLGENDWIVLRSNGTIQRTQEGNVFVIHPNSFEC